MTISVTSVINQIGNCHSDSCGTEYTRPIVCWCAVKKLLTQWLQLVFLCAINSPNNSATRCSLCKQYPWRKLAISRDCFWRRRGHSRWNLDSISAWDAAKLMPTIAAFAVILLILVKDLSSKQNARRLSIDFLWYITSQKSYSYLPCTKFHVILR